MRYKLRTLFAFLTLACVFFAWRAYRLNQQGNYEIGTNYYDDRLTDLHAVAKRIREQTASLPNHRPTDAKIVLSNYCFPAGYGNVARAREIGDQFFYWVRLSDGSQTHVGFWIYRRESREIGMTYVVVGDDTNVERQSGVAGKRLPERKTLGDRYVQIFRATAPDYDLTAK